MQDWIYDKKNTSEKLLALARAASYAVFAGMMPHLCLHGGDLSVSVSFIMALSMKDRRFGFLSLFMLLGAYFQGNAAALPGGIFLSLLIAGRSLFFQVKSIAANSLLSAGMVLFSGICVHRIFLTGESYLIDTAISSSVTFILTGIFSVYFSSVLHTSASSRKTPQEEFSSAVTLAVMLASTGCVHIAGMDMAVVTFSAYILYAGRNLPGNCILRGLCFGMIRVIFSAQPTEGMIVYALMGYFASYPAGKKVWEYAGGCLCMVMISCAVLGIASGDYVPEIAAGAILSVPAVLYRKNHHKNDLPAVSAATDLFGQNMEMMITKQINLGKNALRSLVRGIDIMYECEDIDRKVCRMVVSEVCMKCENYPYCWMEKGEEIYEGFMEDIARCGEDGSEGTFCEYCSGENRIKLSSCACSSYVSVRSEMEYINKIKAFAGIYSRITGHLCEMLDSVAVSLKSSLSFCREECGEILSLLREKGICAEDCIITTDVSGQMRAVIGTASPLGENERTKDIRRILSAYTKREFVYAHSANSDETGGYIHIYEEQYLHCVRSAFARCSKCGEDVCGDSILINDYLQVHICAISDGMGSGVNANDKSRRVISMVDSLAGAGYDYERSVEMINSILTFGTACETFATLDMFIYDKKTSGGIFLKAGSESSYIKRDDEIIPVGGESLPIGMLENTHTGIIHIPLKKGDYVYMFSDGILSSFGYDEEYIRHLILSCPHRFPQKIADEILNSALGMTGGVAEDDISVIVCKIR